MGRLQLPLRVQQIDAMDFSGVGHDGVRGWPG
jgi:hypothetical protein